MDSARRTFWRMSLPSSGTVFAVGVLLEIESAIDGARTGGRRGRRIRGLDRCRPNVREIPRRHARIVSFAAFFFYKNVFGNPLSVSRQSIR